MHQEHAPRVRSPAPAQATTVRPTRLPSPSSLSLSLSLSACARVSALRAPHTPHHTPAHAAAGHRTPHSMGRDNHVPPHTVTPRTQGGASATAAHTPTSPHQRREHARKQASKQAGAKKRTQPHCPTTPSKRANTKARKHPHEHAPRVNTNPSHPQANTPTTSLLFHHPREHKKRPHSSVWAQPSVSTKGEPWKSRRPARTKHRHTTRARRQRTQKRANNPGLRRVPPAPAREDSTREGRSQ